MAKKKVEDMTRSEKKKYLAEFKEELAALEKEREKQISAKRLNENMSSDTANKIVNLGWEHVTSAEPRLGSYFHVFSNYTDNLTFVKSPLEVDGIWLATLWSHVTEKSYTLPEKYGYKFDKLGRYNLETEKDVVKFAEDVTKFLEEQYAGQDKENILEEIVMRRFGRKVGTK